ncbi:glycoside hydrolase domain-containing protein [Nocardioides humi]|uniref:Rv2525c-like glycoside hydrolase-like domain-containing protein n=1 Tax=Nocardioides humi TaxID=449461 RepID=A0ABN1ZSD8_9ACTN|nr:glycoside hydrolase domain-containing protein [Nocardioides humi]
MPSRSVPTPVRHRVRPRFRLPVAGTAAGALTVLLALVLLIPEGPAPAEPPVTDAPVDLAATTTNPVTPGDFTGYGFDQCQTQSQKNMDAWLEHSPFRAVGVYISGNSRFCRDQPNLTPTWVSTQLAKGWRILPITLGPQSTCVGRFPRYGKNIDPTISNDGANGYQAAFKQGKKEAKSAVAAASALGIVPRSTLWYDLEGWSNYKDATCRESALSFLSGWTKKTRKLNYVPGVYSSAGSGIKILDDARIQGRGDVILPDRIWIARWDGVANTSTSYIAEDGWRPGNRMKQYQGGHNETWGGVTINIDSNWLELSDDGTAVPQAACATPAKYKKITPRKSKPKQIRALKCRLQVKGLYPGKMSKKYNKLLRKGIHAWQAQAGQKVKDKWTKKNWASLLSSVG